MRRRGANASAVSARGRTAPTMGFSRPSLTRWARCASWVRSGSTTKKTARPSLGCTVGGIAMVTRVPPARTSAVDRSRHLAADDIQHHVDFAGVLQELSAQVHERVGTEAQHDVAVTGPTGADHPSTHLARKLDGNRSHPAGSAVDQDGLAGGEPGVDEQCLPRGQPRDRQRSGHGVVDVGRERGEVASLDSGVFGQRSVAAPVGEPEHPLADGEASGAVTQLDDDSGQFVPRNAGRAVTAGPVGPGAGPLEFAGVKPAAWTRTMTSFSAACGYGRSVRVSPPTPASRSRTVMACMSGPFTRLLERPEVLLRADVWWVWSSRRAARRSPTAPR